MCCFVLTGAKSVRWLWGFEVMSGSGVVLGTASQLVRSQWSKAIFGNRRSNKLSGAQSSIPNHLHFPQPALFLLQAPQTVLNTLVGQVTLPMSGFDFWFQILFLRHNRSKMHWRWCFSFLIWALTHRRPRPHPVLPDHTNILFQKETFGCKERKCRTAYFAKSPACLAIPMYGASRRPSSTCTSESPSI